MELARYGYTDRCIGCQHARLGLKPADHSEECRARIVRHMTADGDLNQRAQIAQDRIVETAPPEAHELKHKHLRVLCYKLPEHQQQFEQQFQFQQQSDRYCHVDAG